ncbi:MAG: recombinase family protein [Clostridia bacterium]|nr:recombinase family protein [Clostridia bacterium]
MGKTITKIEKSIPDKIILKRVAAYVRVSSGKDAMLHSLSAQVSYYSDMIQHHKGWVYVGVYADEAFTGTKDTRDNFQRLLADCRKGKIDCVITKSISRFARNTVTLLQTVRELKSLGIDVYFEEQNIHSMSSDGELMLTILASYAQEESRSVSENCKWRIRHKFEEGIEHHFTLYGYEKVDGEIKIKDGEAEVVREIFKCYLSGMGITKIAKKLRQDNIPSPKGSSWTLSSVRNVLINEKYMGDMMLQKYYTKDHLCKRSRCNNGELPKYYVEETHPAIISKEDFEKVQKIFSSKNNSMGALRYDYDFKGIVFCGCCGRNYVRKKNYKKYVWKCSAYSKNSREFCVSKQIPDSILHELSDSFEKEIEKIIVLPNNDVKFVFADKSETTKHWVQPSRADSWTYEMKEEAKRKSLERGEM